MYKNETIKFIMLLTTLLMSSVFAGLNVMAPLSINSEDEWQQFERRLHELKANGVTSISTDVWWGGVEAEQGAFNWSYYDRISTLIERAGLKWVPIMSFHQCGGNVGDNCNIPVPKWVWEHAKGKKIPSYFADSDYVVQGEDDVKYLSELGKINSEYPSVWSTPLMKDLYVNFVNAFTKHFESKAHMIEELNISLGPAGELRYPAYNAHDQFYEDSPALFPRRGTFQGHSPLARKSFQDYLRAQYSNNIANLNRDMGTHYESFADVSPLNHDDVNLIEREGFKDTPLNRHTFDWYHQSLLSHGETILKAVDSAKKKGALARVPLGVKIPGIHWNMGEDFGLNGGFKWSHRLTEATSGLISLGDSSLLDPSQGAGYRSLLSRLKSIEDKIVSSFLVHFTCLEMDNNENAHLGAKSMAKNLVHWFGAEAKRHGLTIKGENALEGLLYSGRSWFNIKDALTHAGYDGITILRMGPLTDNHDVKQNLKDVSSLLESRKVAKAATCNNTMKNFLK